MLPLQGVWVGSLAGELKFLHAMWCGPKERKKKKKKKTTILHYVGGKSRIWNLLQRMNCAFFN